MKTTCNNIAGRRKAEVKRGFAQRILCFAIAALTLTAFVFAPSAQSAMLDFSDQGGYQVGYIELEGMNEGDIFDLGLIFTDSSSPSDLDVFKAGLDAAGIEYEVSGSKEIWLVEMEARASDDNDFAWDLADIGDGTLSLAAIVLEPALLSARGGVGGPFEPSTSAIQLKNTHETEDMSWSASIADYRNTDMDWLTLSSSGGDIGPGVSHILQFQLTEKAARLPFGLYAAEIEFTTTIDGETETWSRKIFLNVEPSFPIPYVQDFEETAPDSSASVIGWHPGTSDSSRVIELLYDYDGAFPLPDSVHSQVLLLETGETPLTLDINMQSSPELPYVYLDTMVAFTPSYNKIGENEDFKFEVFMNLDDDLVLAHGGADGEGGTLSVLSSDVEAERWYRLTVIIDFESVDQKPFFQVAIDGNILSSADAGFANPTAVPGEYGGGSYFRFANSENRSLEEDLGIGRIEFMGGGTMIDDFVLRADNPLAASFSVRTELVLAPKALMTADSDWMDPRGDFVAEPFESYELDVDAGESVSISYTAEELHYIQSLSTQNSLSLHGTDVELGPGQSEYSWSLGSVHGDVVNRIVFAPVLYEADGKSPQWWVEALGEESRQAAQDGTSELTVYQGYLLNRLDLLTPVGILDVGIDSDDRFHIRWLGDGAVRGVLGVRATDDLATARQDWPLIDGSTSYDEAEGLSTWRSNEPVDNEKFLLIEVRDN